MLFKKIRYCFEISLIPAEGGSIFSLSISPQIFLHSLIQTFFIKSFFDYREIIKKNVHVVKKSTIRKNRILHIISDIEVGGSQKIVYDLINGLSDKFNMELFFLDHKTLFRSEFNTFQTFSNLDSFAQYLHQVTPEIVHIHYYGDNENMHSFLRKILNSKIKSKFIENSNNPIPVFKHQKIEKFVFVSKFAKRIQKKQTKKNSIIYPSFNLSDFYKKTDGLLPKKTVHIGFVYRLTNDKINQETIFTLIEIVKRSKKQVIFDIVGFGPNFFYYLDQIYKNGVRRNFRFHGFVKHDQLPDIYQTFDLFLAPVKAESFGVVVPYAMAAEVPVIAYNTGAIKEILGSTGTVVQTEKELIKEVLSFLKDPQSFIRRTKSAKNRAKKLFNLPQMLRHYEQVYFQLLNKNHDK